MNEILVESNAATSAGAATANMIIYGTTSYPNNYTATPGTDVLPGHPMYVGSPLGSPLQSIPNFFPNSGGWPLPSPTPETLQQRVVRLRKALAEILLELEVAEDEARYMIDEEP